MPYAGSSNEYSYVGNRDVIRHTVESRIELVLEMLVSSIPPTVYGPRHTTYGILTSRRLKDLRES
jgi:hypothetical protein